MISSALPFPRLSSMRSILLSVLRMMRRAASATRTREALNSALRDVPPTMPDFCSDSMILGLEAIEDSDDSEPYIDIVFKEV